MEKPIDGEQTPPDENSNNEPGRASDMPAVPDSTDDSAAGNVHHGEKQPPDPPAEAVVMPTAPKRKRLPGWLRPEMILLPVLRRRLGKRARAMAIATWAVLLVGCSAGAYAAIQTLRPAEAPAPLLLSVPEKFQVIATEPENGSQNNTNNSSITFRFNKKINYQAMEPYFYVFPEVKGSFTPGQTESEVIFTPAVPFSEGSMVSAMINANFTSADGEPIGADYFLNYGMSVPDNQVSFSNKEYLSIDNLTPRSSNQSISYELMVGKQVDANGTITIYEATLDQLLESFVTVDTESNGYKYETRNNKPLNTAAMRTVSTRQGLKNNEDFTVTQGAGIYVAVAEYGGKQAGHVWLVYSDYGILLKQDDQKLFLAAQELSTGAAATADAVLYNLSDRPAKLGEKTFTAHTEIELPARERIDIVTATINGQSVVVPVNAWYSFADIRSRADLASARQAMAMTDKSTYRPGDTVRFAGFDRTHNDMDYGIAPGTISVYAAEWSGSEVKAKLNVSVDGQGNFSGQFKVDETFLPADADTATLRLYIDDAIYNLHGTSELAAFTVTREKWSDYDIRVDFAKDNYVANEAVTATITAVDDKGSPLANQSVLVSMYNGYVSDHGDSHPSTGFAEPLEHYTDKPQQLDANGKAVVTFNVSQLEKGRSNAVKVSARINKEGHKNVGAADTAVVHEANGQLQFGKSRSTVLAGEPVLARIYGRDLAGTALANRPVSYALTESSYNDTSQRNEERVIDSGNAKFNSNGYVEITASTKSYTLKTDRSFVTLRVTAKDADNKELTAVNYFYIQKQLLPVAYSELQLMGMDITGADDVLKPGENKELTIHAPADVTALISIERGRIKRSELVTLKKGANSYSLAITNDMLPSFGLSIDYFLQGRYMHEGTTLKVDRSSKAVDLTAATSKQSYTAGEEATITLSAKNTANDPLNGWAIITVNEERSYRYERSDPHILDHFYPAFFLTTNSSSSLTGIGSGGGGRCGGHDGYDTSGLQNPIGQNIYWSAKTALNNGQSAVKMKLPKGKWVVSILYADDQSGVGSASTTITAQ